MFYGAFVLAKKGPLAKVWLAAHWDKKLTKAHIFETDVESTVDSIISPKVKMALRTSGHLLLGVVRIYSRKQKYLIHDLGEACAKIRMAFRPGIVDLPAEGRTAATDTITLPEIFHDFETAVADLGALDADDQFMVNPNRVSEITMAEDLTTTGGDIFGEFGEFDLAGGEFGGGMEDIEVPRRTITFSDEKDKSDGTVSKLGEETGDHNTLREERGGTDLAMEEHPPDMGDFGGGDFLADGFGFGDGGLMDLGVEVPNVSNITLGGEQRSAEGKERSPEDGEKETAMEVDPPPAEHSTARQQPPAAGPEEDHDQTAGDTTVIPEGEGGFVLEPLEISTATKERRRKGKRKLVVDPDKELTAEDIKSQLGSYSDTVQQKCFPPPTKKALVWKDMANCEQLFLRPTLPFLASDLHSLITRNYSTSVPGGSPADETLIDLEQDIDVSVDIEKRRDATGVGDTTVAETTSAEGGIPADLQGLGVEPSTSDFNNEFGVADDLRLLDIDGLDLPNGDLDDGATRVIPEMPDLEGEEVSATQTTEDRQSNELSEEFERRRWTRRTQQVLRVIDRGLGSKENIKFSVLAQKCNRKQAASRFYTCLLLAKEGTIHVEQSEPYAEIYIQRGARFTEAF